MEKYDTKKTMIGQGTFGTVYRVKNLNDKKYYAMKLIYIGKERFKQSAEDEIRTLNKFNHKNILKYIESIEEENSLCIVTELCD